MEGDAGASRLNPPPMPIVRRLRRLSRRPGRRIRQESEAEADQISTEETTEVSEESVGEADQIGTEVTTEVSEESEGEAHEISTDETTEDSEESEAEADAGDTGVERGPSRLGRGWLAGIAAALVLAASAIGAGGYLALRFHHDSQAIARNDAAAIKAAKDCVAAT